MAVGVENRSTTEESNCMSTNEVVPERLAELLHHYHQALSSETSDNKGQALTDWKEIPPREKGRLVAAARLALLELECMANGRPTPKPYFAPPSEAEWGC
jgi:hypothetical protein